MAKWKQSVPDYRADLKQKVHEVEQETESMKGETLLRKRVLEDLQ